MKIALGTVQFGFDYGIANSSGQIQMSEAKKIISYASDNGIKTIDTAIAYGSSEQCLGKIGMNDFQVVTKLPEIPKNCGNLKVWAENQLKGSLLNLKINKLSGLLLHRPDQLFDKDKRNLWEILQKFKAKGYVNKIGFSIYNPDDLTRLCQFYSPDIVQAPYNIFDRRLDESGWLKRLSDENIEIHIRSIFLQGLLLMNLNSRMEKFNEWSNLWIDWEKWLIENDCTPVQASLSFALSDDRISKIVVGVDNLIHLKEIVGAAEAPGIFPKSFKVNDKRLLNPSEWGML